MVEFQPSSWAKGSFLNVGVNFHWYRQYYFSFDIGYREAGFFEFRSPQQFAPAMEKMAVQALKKVQDLREKLSTQEKAMQTVLDTVYESQEWGNYHKATLCGLQSNWARAEPFYAAILAQPAEYAWKQELHAHVRNLINPLERDHFKHKIAAIIEQTRAAKKLKPTAVQTAW